MQNGIKSPGCKTIEWLKKQRDPMGFATILDESKREIEINNRLNTSREHRESAERSWNE